MSSDVASVPGEHRLDPVRVRFIEAMARRASTHDGEARRILDERLATLLAHEEDVEKAQSEASNAVRPKGPPERGPLADLVDHIAQHSSSEAEPKALDYFRNTWFRLSAERRLTQSLETVPEKAGPLNSHHLVHRSLTLMRELSPEYLHQFMSYVDTLLWLDQVNGAGASAGADSPRAEGSKKSGRGRSA